MIWPIVAGAASTVVLNKLFAAEAEQFWGGRTGWNDASDAFRHAYVSARFAQYFGEHTPNILGIVHESLSRSDDRVFVGLSLRSIMKFKIRCL
jgi:hypothetical protein